LGGERRAGRFSFLFGCAGLDDEAAEAFESGFSVLFLSPVFLRFDDDDAIFVDSLVAD